MPDFEKLGSFYLGKIVDGKSQVTTEDLLLYDAKDLTTHALCVGMTGSGKTGLCIGLLEEAAIDGIPAIVIDPKGDIGNLMLTFPGLSASEFRPWIDEGEALRKGQTPDAFAQSTATMWKDGLAQWGQDAARIERLKSAADFAIYTPGSSSGLPITILKSFSAPKAAILADNDALQDRVQGAVSGLLGLLGIDADPVQSREHILLSNILHEAWRSGKDLALTDLIRAIMSPPFTHLGVFDMETFYPASERSALAMRLNNVIASPSFSSWMEGEPLDIERLLHTEQGKPRISIISIAHLNDEERMFFVTLLLNEMISWMRQQAGTASLRAILYMDEIFGYFPPSANPPSKAPMLTLLKQARAYGLGCVLATQNPVDLDYKGLGNTGTWFIGRLQTERDKMRVLDGLEGASAAAGQAFSRAEMDIALSGLDKRVFLMNNVHDDAPVMFNTRWAMSYLRGPLSKQHIETLMAPRKSGRGAQLGEATHTVGGGSGFGAVSDAPSPGSASFGSQPDSDSYSDSGGKNALQPMLPSAVPQSFVKLTKPLVSGSRLVYRPMLAATAQMHFVHAKARLDDWMTFGYHVSIPESLNSQVWDAATVFTGQLPATGSQSEQGATFSDLPAIASGEKNYDVWMKMLESHLYQNHVLELKVDPKSNLISSPNESEGTFQARVQHANREMRDAELAKLKDKYAPKLSALNERIRKAEMRVEREESQYERSKISTAVSVGSTLLGALLGRKAVSIGSMQRAASTMNRAGSTMRERSDIARAGQDLDTEKLKLAELEAQFQADATAIATQIESTGFLEDIQVRPRKSDISVSRIAVAWTPWQVDSNGIADRLY